MAATLEDFVVFTNYRDLDEFEQEQIEKLLLVAERMILDFTGNVWERSGSSEIADGRQIQMVRRYFDNQRGLTAAMTDGVQESYDDRAYEGLRLTPEDKRQLGRLRDTAGTFGRVRFHRNFGQVW